MEVVSAEEKVILRHVWVAAGWHVHVRRRQAYRELNKMQREHQNAPILRLAFFGGYLSRPLPYLEDAPHTWTFGVDEVYYNSQRIPLHLAPLTMVYNDERCY